MGIKSLGKKKGLLAQFGPVAKAIRQAKSSNLKGRRRRSLAKKKSALGDHYAAAAAF
jgi:hypothetical protein